MFEPHFLQCIHPGSENDGSVVLFIIAMKHTLILTPALKFVIFRFKVGSNEPQISKFIYLTEMKNA